ncbi:hypothetical protein, partial [Streptomyces sp. NPDC059134]|uniref:hypothetical protein n=1 Tax=Streptomyces sp. NPDC059134 TaxID=3346738 RepID=UPI003688AE43
NSSLFFFILYFFVFFVAPFCRCLLSQSYCDHSNGLLLDQTFDRVVRDVGLGSGLAERGTGHAGTCGALAA